MMNQNDLSKIAARCNQITNSPYLIKHIPEELAQLRSFLELTRVLVVDEVPSLIAEVKWLRNQNKKLREENELLRRALPANQTQQILSAQVISTEAMPGA